MPAIEFVDPDPGRGEDEELVTGRPPRSTPSTRSPWLTRSLGSRRTTRTVRTGAVLAVVAAGVVIGVVRHGGGGSDRAAAPAPSGANVSSAGAVPVDQLTSGAARSDAVARGTSAAPSTASATIYPSDCPNVDACTVDLSVPPAVTAALTHAFTSIADVQGHSVIVDGPRSVLRSRTVTGTVGPLQVSVVVHPATRYDNPTASVAEDGATRIVYARTLSQGLAVTVSASGAPARVPNLATVRALAADRRLLAVD